VVSRDSGICHICLHSGAKSADHVIPVTERPDLALDTSNMKAAHGYPHPCPECSSAAIKRGGKNVYCNETRQAMSIARARRIIEERTGLNLGDGIAEHKGEEGRDVWLRPALFPFMLG
jgi:hypothetical protein